MGPQLFSLQGSFFLAERTAAGKPGRQWWAGDTADMKLALDAQKFTTTESFSGSRGLYGSQAGTKGGKITGSFKEWLTKNLALGLYAVELDVTSGSVSGEELPADLEVGDYFSLDKPYASSLVITDSTGTPVTVPSSKYRAAGHNERTFEVIGDLSSYTQPLQAAYTNAAYEDLECFSDTPKEIYGIFDGINTETGKGVVFDFYRTKFDPFANQDLLHAEYGSLPFSADLLFDPLNLNASGKGGFYKQRRKALT